MAAAIEEAFSDPDRARARGEAGFARARDHFAWASIAQRTMDVYEKVLGGFND
jgi:starch synthase